MQELNKAWPTVHNSFYLVTDRKHVAKFYWQILPQLAAMLLKRERAHQNAALAR